MRYLSLILLMGIVVNGMAQTKKIKSPKPLTFEQAFKNFGKVKVGENPSFTYQFTNTSKEDVKIEIVSGCDCTDLDWPDGKVFKPGESGTIKATFVSSREEERGELDKTVDVLLENTDPKTGNQIYQFIKFKLFLED